METYLISLLALPFGQIEMSLMYIPTSLEKNLSAASRGKNPPENGNPTLLQQDTLILPSFCSLFLVVTSSVIYVRCFPDSPCKPLELSGKLTSLFARLSCLSGSFSENMKTSGILPMLFNWLST